jgi:hypothetical protein
MRQMLFGGKTLQVESDTLDNILATDKPSVMKMDIERAEFWH